MGKKIEPKDFLLNTDYEMDKVIYFTEGKVNTADEYQKKISHNLGFAPLVFGVCSFNANYSDPRTIPYDYQTQSTTVYFYARATDKDIRLEFGDFSGGRTIYYRIYGFEPSDSRAKIGATSKYAKRFILNTDYNYCKLYKKGILNGDGTISHNLGYVPQVLAWQEGTDPIDSKTTIAPIENSEPSNPMATPQQTRVTSSVVTFEGYPSKIHYRIYYDEA